MKGDSLSFSFSISHSFTENQTPTENSTKPINPNTCVIICTGAAGCRCHSLSVFWKCLLSLPMTLDTNGLLICCRSEIYQSKHPKAKTLKLQENQYILYPYTGWMFSPHVRSLIFSVFTPFFSIPSRIFVYSCKHSASIAIC